MILDAPAFQPVLTPEAALGIVQKGVKEKGWGKYEVTDVKLVYTPYWLFSFDIVSGAQGQPSGKTALNAFTGELSDFVPILFERPLKKSKQTQEGVECEVEETAVKASEVKDVARDKVASQLGLKGENVSVSAFSKHYAPSYRVWVDVAGDTHRIDVDACLGAPLGIDGIPEREKTFGEKAGETIGKMKSPQGWMEVGGKAAGELAKPSGKNLRYVVLGFLIIILLYFVFVRPLGGGGVSCSLDKEFLGKPVYFGLFGENAVKPSFVSGSYLVRGSCQFTNPSDNPVTVVVQVKVSERSTGEIYGMELLTAQPPGKTTLPTTKSFEMNWTNRGNDYKFEYQRMG